MSEIDHVEPPEPTEDPNQAQALPEQQADLRRLTDVPNDTLASSGNDNLLQLERISAQETDALTTQADHASRPEPLTPEQVEDIRIGLSAAQIRGVRPDGKIEMDGRWLEEVTTLALNGEWRGGKHVYDVVVNDQEGSYGISCKMKGAESEQEFDQIARGEGRVPILLTSATSTLRDSLRNAGLNEKAPHENPPEQVGRVVLDTIKSWYQKAESNEHIEQDRSYFLVDVHAPGGRHQLFQYGIDSLPDPTTLEWSFEGRSLRGVERQTGDTVVTLEGGEVLKWYPAGRGQVEFKPAANRANWKSQVFTLEPVPAYHQYSIRELAKNLFGRELGGQHGKH